MGIARSEAFVLADLLILMHSNESFRTHVPAIHEAIVHKSDLCHALGVVLASVLYKLL